MLNLAVQKSFCSQGQGVANTYVSQEIRAGRWVGDRGLGSGWQFPVVGTSAIEKPLAAALIAAASWDWPRSPSHRWAASRSSALRWRTLDLPSLVLVGAFRSSARRSSGLLWNAHNRPGSLTCPLFVEVRQPGSSPTAQQAES